MILHLSSALRTTYFSLPIEGGFLQTNLPNRLSAAAPEDGGFPMNTVSKLQKRLALPLLFLFVVALLFCALGTPAHAGDVAGVSTRLYLTVTGDVDGDAKFLVTYWDALGTHSKTYYAGMEIAAWTPVTITVTNHTAEHWTLDADVQENWLQGVGGVTEHGDVFRVTGTNTVQVFATNFGLHYVNVHVALSELDDADDGSGGSGSGGNGGSGDNGGTGGNGSAGDNSGTGGSGGSGDNGGSGGNGGGTDPSNPGGNGGNSGTGGNGGGDPSGPNGDGDNGSTDNTPDADDNKDNDGGKDDGGKTPGDNGNGGSNGGDKGTARSNAPKTGDTRIIGTLVILALLCVVVFAVTYIRRRKKAN